ncbi:MAG: DUF1501 domain-containing protein [Saccharospirillaceae bacterium]|nr:DUF1501 domain-containing protein [Pseudomonadales bacterium]NRB81203.1 DUF1501 domain-containing protein [Saccharospirillaceae bacterium]
MLRRDFFKNATLATGSMALPFVSLKALAAGERPEQFFVYYHCSGGWDPTSLLDPKGDADRGDNRGDDSRVNKFTASQILSRGNIRYAPLWINNQYIDDADVGVVDPSAEFSDELFSLNTLNNSISNNTNTRNSAQTGLYNAFMKHYQNKLRIINGVNHQTNSHTTGRRNASSGTNEMDYPNFSALYAAQFDSSMPMAYITDGAGYNFSAGLVPETRLDSLAAIEYLANPNKFDDNNNYFEDSIMQRLKAARSQREFDILKSEALVSRKQQILLSQQAKGENELAELIEAISPSGGGAAAGLNSRQQQMSIAAGAFSKGLAASCHISSRGGFDTHGDSDNRQSAALRGTLSDLHHLWQQLELQGVADRTTVLVGSDFGRTPWYNSNNGKDHWNVSSMMVMGNGVVGNTVIQASDALVNAIKVNPVTFLPDDNGVTITPAVVHQSLRNVFNISNSAFAKEYSLNAEAINLFTS